MILASIDWQGEVWVWFLDVRVARDGR